MSATANTIAEPKHRHRRAVTVVGIYLQAPETVAAGLRPAQSVLRMAGDVS